MSGQNNGDVTTTPTADSTRPSIANGASEIGASVQESLSGIKENVAHIATQASDQVAAAYHVVQNTAADLIHKTQEAGGQAAVFIGGAYESAAQSGVGEQVAAAYHTVQNKASDLAHQAAQSGVGEQVAAAYHTVQNKASDLAHQATEQLGAAYHAVQNKASQLVNQTQEAADQAVDNTKQAANELGEQMTAVYQAAESKANEINTNTAAGEQTATAAPAAPGAPHYASQTEASLRRKQTETPQEDQAGQAASKKRATS